ncbi:MAG: peptidoglycan DD-metalloendopeptidase family protein [Cyclobacteriaceae bacterium]|nr:peptidoglycan DD-metalloendopeptidase family protein [Cyclobacteriaceae bacterium]
MKKIHWGVLGVITIASLSYLSLRNFSPLLTGSSRNTPISELKTDSISVKKHVPTILYGIVVDSMVVIEDKIKRNQNISEILNAYNISFQKIHLLANTSKSVFDVRKVVPNRKYTLICYPDSLQTAKAMVYEPNATEYVIFNLDDSVTVEKVEKEVITIERELAGTIEMSLAVTMDELGASPQLTNDFVDVFAWQIDFFRLQKGDQFKIVYEEKQVEGETIGIGQIKGVYFQHFGHDYYAYYYNQGSGVDYFDEEGNSLRKALLKYPLDFTRISSRYSGRRYHPVQKRYKAHRGTDFSAPSGTPIRAVGDGIILEARYGKYNGNYVKLKHNATFTTQYLHMSKIASGVRPGTRVRQGQTIGYVGRTGLATGNHLCYRFWKNGVQIDALKVQLPPSEPIQEVNFEDYTQVVAQMKKQLDAIPLPIKTVEMLVAKANP